MEAIAINGLFNSQESMRGKGVVFFCNTAPYQAIKWITSPSISFCVIIAIDIAWGAKIPGDGKAIYIPAKTSCVNEPLGWVVPGGEF